MVIVITMSMTVTVGLEMEGGRSSVVSSASEFKSEDPEGVGSRLRGGSSVPLSQLLCRIACACMTPLRVYDKPPHLGRTLKIPYVVKRVGLTAGGMETRKHCTQRKKG